MQTARLRSRNPSAVWTRLGMVVRLKTHPLPRSVRKHKTHSENLWNREMHEQAASLWSQNETGLQGVWSGFLKMRICKRWKSLKGQISCTRKKSSEVEPWFTSESTSSSRVRKIQIKLSRQSKKLNLSRFRDFIQLVNEESNSNTQELFITNTVHPLWPRGQGSRDASDSKHRVTKTLI